MIIDIHTHAWPEKVSQRARENLEQLFKARFVGDPTVGTLLAFMDKNHVDISVICAVATRPDQVASINDWLFSVRGARIKVFCAMHPQYPSWKSELGRIKKSGDGIKFQPEFQDFYVDDPAVYPLYEVIEKLGLPILFHCGEELSGTMLVRSSPERVARVKQHFPGLTIIAGHFGGFRLWDEVEAHLLGQDIYLDTSFFFGFLPKEKITQLIVRHRPDRLLFGTDFPLVDQQKDLDSLRRLALDPALEERILSLNARQILSI